MAAVSSCGGNAIGSDVAAKVGGETLTFDQLTASAQPDRPAFADGDAVRAETSAWAQQQLASSSGIDAIYQTAVADFAILCPDVLPPAEPTAEAVDALVTQIETEGWDAVADLISATTQTSTAQPCQSIGGAPDGLIGPLAAAAPGEPVSFADETFGYGVVRVRPFEAVDAGEFLQVLAEADSEAYATVVESMGTVDVYVNPRIGSYSPVTQTVEPIG